MNKLQQFWQKLNKLINKNKLITILGLLFTFLLITTIIVFNYTPSENKVTNNNQDESKSHEKPNNLQKTNENSHSNTGVVEVDVLPSSSPSNALQSQNTALQNNLNQQQRQIQQQIIMLQESQAAKEYLKQKHTQYTKIVEVLVQKMNNTTQNKQNLQKEINEYKTIIKDYEDKKLKITQLEETIKSLTQTLEKNQNQEKEINELKNIILQLQNELQNYKDKDNQLSTTISQGNATIENLKNELARVKNELEAKTKAVNDAITAKNKAESELEAKNNELARVKNELEDKIKAKNELKAKIAQMVPGNEKTKLENELTKLENELTAKNNELARVKNELEAKVKAVNDAITAKNKAESELEAKNNELARLKNELEDKNKELETKVKTLTDEKNALETNSTQTITALNKQSKKLQQDSEQKINNSLSSIDTLNQKLTDLYNELKYKETNIHNLNKQLTTVKSQNEYFLNQLNTKLQELKQLAQDKDNVKYRLLDEIQELKRKLYEQNQNNLKTLKNKDDEINKLKSAVFSKRLLEPYNIFSDHEGNIIREYKLFDTMQPKAKSHSGYNVYFERKDFDEIMNKYELESFLTRWTTNRENLCNYEYENSGRIAKKHGWGISKANYQIIQTNKPNNTAYNMTQDREGNSGFWNKSNCFLNSINNQDLKDVLVFENDKTPYIRFCTKNLEVEFDWFNLIATEFRDYMPQTKEVQEYTVKAQENTVKAQEYTSDAQVYTALAQECTAEAQEYTVLAQKYPKMAQKYTAEAQECTAMAQNIINSLQSTHQPKNISINLTTKTIPDYFTGGTKSVPYCEVTYDLQELKDFINKLDLSNNSHLQKIRQFVNDYTQPVSKPIEEGDNDMM
ncbi:putative membrane protein [Candidatus Phytoplasma solani]|uniref:hypothetical protein n=1 Tax=Candidatus Phytoplasma solani TaxID=69896 RepID=UPI0032DBF370